MTIRSFEAAIDAYINEDIPREAMLLARVVATSGLQKVVLKSPVDTGRFRMGWFVTIGERTDKRPPEQDKPGKRGKTARSAAAASGAITDGIAVINTAKPFQSIILQNNVEYGEELEDGHSDQAPRGMLALTVAELEQAFR